MAGRVHCHPTFRLHSERDQSQGAGSGSMPYVKSRAPSHAEPGRQLRWFPVPKPGRAWLGPLWPNRGAGFGPQRIAFRSSPHPSPGAYKRSSMEPLESSLARRSSCLCFAPCRALLPNMIGVRLPERASSSSSSSSRSGSGVTAVFRDFLPCCRRPATPALPDGPVQSARCHEPWQSN